MENQERQVNFVTNENRFSGKADVYAKCRPAYPEAYIDYLMAAAGLEKGAPVADIGAGTGILTGQLLRRGWKVTAVEPNGDMRREMERRLGRCGGFTAMPGTAEATSIAAGSVVLVTAAQAFHWFDPALFRAECRRILSPAGKVALVWNNRDGDSELVRANAEICRAFCPAFRGFSGGRMAEMPELFRNFFRGGGYEEKQFRHDLAMDETGFVGRNLSASYAPRPGDPSYGEFVAAVRRLFADHARNGRIEMPNQTRRYLGNH